MLNRDALHVMPCIRRHCVDPCHSRAAVHAAAFRLRGGGRAVSAARLLRSRSCRRPRAPPPRAEVLRVRRPGGAGGRAGGWLRTWPSCERSRRGLFAADIASLLWLGFWRGGCICPIGSIQNVTLAAVRFQLRASLDGGRDVRAADPVHALLRPDLLRGRLPVGGGAGIGRRSGRSTCPTGSTRPWACWPTSTSGRACCSPPPARPSSICRYDPFVGFFRHSAQREHAHPRRRASWWAASSSAGRIAATCAPTARFSGCCRRCRSGTRKIPPDECIQCRLCEDACPYGAIREPTVAAAGRRAAARPAAPGGRCWPPARVLMAAGFWLGRQLETPLARVHPTGSAGRAHPLGSRRGQVEGTTDAQRRLPQHGPLDRRPLPRGRLCSAAVSAGPAAGSARGWDWWSGAKLIYLSVRRRRTDYQPDRAACVSCGRCFWYCPSEQARQGWIQRDHTVSSQRIMSEKPNDAALSYCAARIAAVAGVLRRSWSLRSCSTTTPSG